MKSNKIIIVGVYGTFVVVLCILWLYKIFNYSFNISSDIFPSFLLVVLVAQLFLVFKDHRIISRKSNLFATIGISIGIITFFYLSLSIVVNNIAVLLGFGLFLMMFFLACIYYLREKQK